MELCPNGELFDLLVKSTLSEESAAQMFFDMVNAVRHCHEKDVIHRDVKPENFLLDESMRVKLADFGLSRTLRDNGRAKTPCGSMGYAAPELLRGEPYDRRVDVWSLGVTLWAMVFGCLPWGDQASPRAVVRKILAGDLDFQYQVSSHLYSLFIGVLEVDVTKRMSLDDICNHPWIRQHVTLNKDYTAKHADVVSPGIKATAPSNPTDKRDLAANMDDVLSKIGKLADDRRTIDSPDTPLSPVANSHLSSIAASPTSYSARFSPATATRINHAPQATSSPGTRRFQVDHVDTKQQAASMHHNAHAMASIGPSRANSTTDLLAQVANRLDLRPNAKVAVKGTPGQSRSNSTNQLPTVLRNEYQTFDIPEAATPIVRTHRDSNLSRRPSVLDVVEDNKRRTIRAAGARPIDIPSRS